MDERTKQANDEMALTKIRIRNIQRDEKLMKPIWTAKQQELYKNTLEIGQPTSLSQIISDEVSNEIANIGNPLNKDTALQNLLNITKNPMDAQYILEHLSEGALLYLNFNFNKIVSDIKMKHQKMNKLVFINYLEMENNKDPVPLFPPEINEIGLNRQVNEEVLRDQQRAQANKNLSMNNIVTKEHQQEIAKDLKKRSIDEFKGSIPYIKTALEKEYEDRLENDKNNYLPRDVQEEIQKEFAKNEGRKILNRKKDEKLLKQKDAPNIKINPIDDDPNRTEAENTEPADKYHKERVLSKLKDNAITNFIEKVVNEKADNQAEKTAKKKVLSKLGENNKRKKSLKKAENNVKELHNKIIEKTAFENMKGKAESKKSEREEKERRTVESRNAQKEMMEREYRSYLSKMKKNDLLDEAESTFNLHINKQKRKNEIIDILVKHELQTKGFGIYGKGAEEPRDKNYVYIDKFYVDCNKLNSKNQLVVKYIKNNGYSHKMKPTIINTDTKEVINDILKNKFDPRLFNKLQEMDQRIIKRFVKTLNINVDIPIDDIDKKFQKEFELYLGEYRAGNDSHELKSKLKKYVIEAINENILPRHQGMLLIYELSI